MALPSAGLKWWPRWDGSRHVRPGPRIFIRFMRRGFGERIICAASRRKPKRLSAMFWRRCRSGAKEEWRNKGNLTDAFEASIQNNFRVEIMSKQTRVSHPIYSLLPTEVEGFDSLAELALDPGWARCTDTDAG